MKLKVVVHEEDGGYWAEVPAIPGCVTQAGTFDELLGRLYEAVDGCSLRRHGECGAEVRRTGVLDIAV